MTYGTALVLARAVILRTVTALILAVLVAECAYAIAWGGRLEGALQTARDRRQPAMVYFYVSQDKWCNKMESETFGNSEVSALSGKFMCVRVNYNLELHTAEGYGVQRVPSVLFFTADGARDRRTDGYVDWQTLVRYMKPLVGGDGSQTGSKDDVVKKGDKAGKKSRPPDSAGPTIAQATGAWVSETSDAVKRKMARMKNNGLELQGIFSSRGVASALINGVVVKTGGRVEGWTVISIEKDFVRLESGAKKFELR